MTIFTDDELDWLKAVDMGQWNNQSIDVEYEERLLLDLKAMLRIFNKEVYQKMHATSEVCAYLGGALDVEEVQFYLAANYANLGYLGMPQIVSKKDFLTHDEKKISNLHTMYSMDFTRSRGLDIASYLVYMHHELPNGRGYHKEQKLEIDAAYLIHIADNFVGMLTHKSYRPAYSKRSAISAVLQPYEHYDVFGNKMKHVRDALTKIDIDELGL